MTASSYPTLSFGETDILESRGRIIRHDLQESNAGLQKVFLPLPLICLIGVAVLSFWQGRLIPGAIVIKREDATGYAIIEAALLVTAMLSILAEFVVRRRPLLIEREHKVIFAVIGAWAFVSALALCEGLALGNNMNYALGDWYKFTRYILVFLIVYYSIQSIRQIHVFYLLLTVAWVGFVLCEIGQSYRQIVSGGRLTSYAILASSSIVPVLLCLRLLSRDRVNRGLIVFALGIALIAPVIAQTKSNLASILITFVLVGYLCRRFQIGAARRWTYATPLAFLVVLLLGSLGVFLLRDSLRAPSEAFRGRILTALQGTGRFDDPSLTVGGSRIPEALAIWSQFDAAPWKLPCGFGCGSSLRLGASSKHFVHIGLVEIVFRTGVIGLMAFIGLQIAFLRYALKGIKHNRHFLLPSVVGIIWLVNLTFLLGNPFTVAPVYTMPIFAGMLKIRPLS